MTTYNGNLIAAGEFDSIGGIAANNIAMWNGSSWSALGSGIITIDTAHLYQFHITSLVVYNGELYAAGQFDTAGGVAVNNIAKWNGSSWSNVGSGILTRYFGITTINSLAICNGALYAGGCFDTAGGVRAQNIARWDGISWSDIGGVWSPNGISSVGCLMEYNNLLYVGGDFDSIEDARAFSIATWNDTIWNTLGNGINGLGGNYPGISCMAFYNGDLYAGGNLQGPYYYITKWNGIEWSFIDGTAGSAMGQTTMGQVYSLFPFDGSLIMGGDYSSIQDTPNTYALINANNIGSWNGANWSEFGGGISGFPFSTVFALNTYNGYLYAGGNFTQAGSDTTNSIAEYTCTTDGVHEVSADHVHVYPNPTTGMVNISIDNAEAGASVQIYDLLGQKIYQSNISSGNTSIDLSGHAAGSYLYHISGASGESIAAGTLIVE